MVWAQLTATSVRRLWGRSVATAATDNDGDRPSEDFFGIVHHWALQLRGNLLAIQASDAETKDIDAEIMGGFLKLATAVTPPPRSLRLLTVYLLFFDGGSRGNPGPGGSGSVIVRLGDNPGLVWAASMAYGQQTTTNNQAEYHGLCHGLTAAERHQWLPLEVVGDSMMIIRQMKNRHRPKAPSLLPLYDKARVTADALRVRGWHHYYRSYSKMADKAANQAMDSGASYQADAGTRRPELTELQEWLVNDVNHWMYAQDRPRWDRDTG